MESIGGKIYVNGELIGEVSNVKMEAVKKLDLPVLGSLVLLVNPYFHSILTLDHIEVIKVPEQCPVCSNTNLALCRSCTIKSISSKHQVSPTVAEKMLAESLKEPQT